MERADRPSRQTDIVLPKRSWLTKWVYTAMLFFFLASVFGATMRFMFVTEVPFLDYMYVLHAHSHTAMLGWLFMLLTGSMIYFSLPNPRAVKHKLIFILSAIAALGMAGAFLYQGYGPYSIAFSTLHVVTMYLFAYFYLKELRQQAPGESKKLFTWSIIWLLISSLGIWPIGITSATLDKLHPLYFASIQFFLHFQFNGWFTYAALGLLLFYLNKYGTPVKISNTTFALIHLSLLLTYAQSITWSTPEDFLFVLNALGVIIQLVAYGIVAKQVFEALKTKHNNLASWPDWFIKIGLISLLLKILVQTMVVIPDIAVISYTIRNYVIAFIHLIMLGFITFTVSGILLKEGIFKWNFISRIGWFTLLAGFVITEFILFGQGTLLWMRLGFIANYYLIIFLCTLLLPIGIGFVVLGSFMHRLI